MRKWMSVLGVLAVAGVLRAQEESVYAPPEPVTANEGTNQGGVSFKLDVMYLSDYVYRGVDYTEVVDPATKAAGHEDALDVHSDFAMQFDLGERVPHPFIRASVNLFDTDPVSQFQEIRSAIGSDLTLQPVTFTLAAQNYTLPQREDVESSEVYGQILLNDSRIFHSDEPVFSPYVLGAYDYDINDGWYIEVGASHDFVFEDLFLTIRPVFRIAYTVGWQQQFAFNVDDGTGWQHVEYGVEADYKLNSLLNISKRWGEWNLRAKLMHTDHLASKTVGSTQTWGGLGIGMEY